MEVIFFLLPIVLLIVVVAVAGFLWSLRTGQLDDLDTPAVRMLFDEDSELENVSKQSASLSVERSSKKEGQ